MFDVFFTVCVALAASVLVLLVLAEVRTWRRARRKAPPGARPALRLLRRGLGALLLIGALALLRMTPSAPEEMRPYLSRVLAALTLCLAAVGLALWDFLAMRGAIGREMDQLTKESLHVLRRRIEEEAKRRAQEESSNGEEEQEKSPAD